MTNAILEVTDGTNTVSLINGPFYLDSWRPGVADYKEGGIYVDPPLSDNRRLVFRRFGNVNERFDIKQRSLGPDEAARDMKNLQDLLEDAANYWVSGQSSASPVYLVAKAKDETNSRYAAIVKGRIPEMENPFSSPFMQPDCAVIQDNMNLIIERTHWASDPPGQASAITAVGDSIPHNYITVGDFELGPSSQSWWSQRGSPTSVEYTQEDSYSGRYSVKIIGSSGGFRGIYQDITGITSGEEYTITVWTKVIKGESRLIAWDGGAETNPVAINSQSETWDQISVTKTATAGGIRVALLHDTTADYEGYFDNAQLVRYHGQGNVDITSPKVVSNYRGLTHITHIYEHDNPAYTANRLDASFPYSLLPATAIVDDAAYFGSMTGPAGTPSTSMIGGPFASLAMNLQTGASVSGGELLSNTGFEANLTGWDIIEVAPAFGVTRSSTFAHGGSWSARMELIEGWINTGTFVTSSFTAITGDTAKFNGWLKWDPSSDTSASPKQFFIDWYDSSSVFISRDTTNIGSFHTSWVQYEVLSTKPPAGTKVKVGVHLGASGGGGSIVTMYLDDASLVEPTTSLTVIWEYWDGAAWSTIPSIRDDTNGLQQSGGSTVAWELPVDWGQTTVNSIDAWWVRARVSAISGTFSQPTVGQYHPYVVTEPYIEIPDENIGGQIKAPAKLEIRSLSAAGISNLSLALSNNVDDQLADDGGSTLTDGNSTENLGQDMTLGIRFRALNIPQAAKIVGARLHCIPWGVAPAVSERSALYRINGEAVDDSAVFSTYANFAARTRTSAFTEWDIDQTWWEIREQHQQPSPEIAPIIQEIVDRGGWAEGNDMTLFVTDWVVGVTDYRTFRMREGTGGSFRLEVRYVDNDKYTTSVFLGARSKSRGEDFNAYIHMIQNLQPGISIEAPSFLPSWDSPRGLLTPVINNSSIRTGVNQNDGTFREVAKIIIGATLAQQYVGRFRAFLRAAHSSSKPSGEETRFRLKMSVGGGGAVAIGESSLASYDQPELIDLGLVSVPSLGNLDALTFFLEAARDVSGHATVFDFILIPIDEWFGEFTNKSTTPESILDGDSVLVVDSISNEKRKGIEAFIQDEVTGKTTASIDTSSLELSLSPNGDQRIWIVAAANTAATFAEDTIVRASLLNAVHSIQVFASRRYLSMRGAS